MRFAFRLFLSKFTWVSSKKRDRIESFFDTHDTSEYLYGFVYFIRIDEKVKLHLVPNGLLLKIKL
jgi:hypothetical protein